MKTTLRLSLAAFGLATFNLSAATLHVSLLSTNPVSPYATWANAATNIQDAVDVSKAGDTVLVTNGVYATGGKTNEYGYLCNRVSITNAIRLESVNGPLVTTIDGGGSGRCVYLGASAVLSGFTLMNGCVSVIWGSGSSGGGVFSEPSGIVTNCTVSGNVALGSASTPCGGRGGGAYGGTFYNCTLTGNLAGSGGGADSSTLYNCTLTGNSIHCDGVGGAGAYLCTLYNCTLTANSVWGSGGGAGWSTLYNCTLTGNAAYRGGGACVSTLYNCTLTGNSAAWFGGGASGCTLYNCTVTGNDGGGSAGSTLYNCTVTGNDGGGVTTSFDGSTVFNSIVYYNFGGNYANGTILNYCCTTPLPTNGVGNITTPPWFMDWAAGDFRLREESPCIDAGTNLIGFPIMGWDVELNNWTIVGHITDPADILGNTRFIDGNFDGTVAWDIGAYEFNSFRPPRFTCGPQLTANGWQLNITGAANQWVRLQRSSDLRNWENIWFGWMGSEGVKQVTDGDMGQKVMFYRAVVE